MTYTTGYERVKKRRFPEGIGTPNGSHCNWYESYHRFSQERESSYDVSSSLARIVNPGDNENIFRSH